MPWCYQVDRIREFILESCHLNQRNVDIESTNNKIGTLATLLTEYVIKRKDNASKLNASVTKTH